MGYTGKIDLSADRLIAIAADDIEDHNYIGALKMLNKNAVLNGNDEDSFMLYAEAFDDMGLSEKCINGWFKYIDYAGDGADLAEAYEGIAVNFMNMGQENFAAYYYNKLLLETNAELTPENRQEIIRSFISPQKQGLRIVYPPRFADYSEEIEKGIDLMRSNDYDGAVKEFEKVGEGNERYNSARNYIAMCNVICDDCEQAEQECMRILEKSPEDVQALTTLAAVKSQKNEGEQSRALARRLLKINPEATDDLYKIATVCCENGMHEEAYSLFCRLEEELEYDSSLLYFKAVAAFNCGKREKSLETFDKLLTIYPNAITADYWHYEVLRYPDVKDKQYKELDYFYRLPRSESQANLEFLTALNRLTDKQAEKVCEEADVSGCVHWCFDEGDGNTSYEMRLLGAFSAVKAGLDDTVRDILLDAFLQDAIKMETISALAQRNRGGDYGVVICNIYRKITLLPITVGRNKNKIFRQAYGLAVSRFAILENEYSYMLQDAAERLYDKMAKEGRLRDARSVSDLAAAVFKFSGIKENELTEEQMSAFFGADMRKVSRILGD